MTTTEMCNGCQGEGWMTAGLEKCPNCNGTGEIKMITENTDAEYLNLEIRLQKEQLLKDLMEFLGQKNSRMLVKDGQIFIEMVEVKSGSSIIQHSTEIRLGHQFTYFG